VGGWIYAGRRFGDEAKERVGSRLLCAEAGLGGPGWLTTPPWLFDYGKYLLKKKLDWVVKEHFCIWWLSVVACDFSS